MGQPAAGLSGGRRIVGRFAPNLRGQRRLIVGGLLALFVEVLLRLAEPWPLGFIIDRLTAPAGDVGVVGVAALDRLSPENFLAIAAAALVVLAGLRALASYLSTIAFALAGNRVVSAVRLELFRHLQRLSLAYHAKARTGDLVARLTGDVGRLQEVLVTAALPLTGNIVTLLGMTGVMLWLDWKLTLIALVAFPVFSLVMVSLTRRISSASRDVRRSEGVMAAAVSETLGAMRVVQTYSLERRFSESFERQNTRNLKDGVKGARLAASLERRTDLIVAVATGAVVVVGGRQVLGGAISVGELVVFIAYLKSGFMPMRDLAKYTGRIAKAIASGERILEVLDARPDVAERQDARLAPRFRGEVHLTGVSLAYELGHDVLSDVDLHVPAGQRVALLGPSGGGKSSLVGLLPRLYDPTGGRVAIDGLDVRDLTLESLREQIGVVLQESVLFATSIRENIALGIRLSNDARIEEAARLANAHDFIMALPQGYDTVVGERGATLSGGQRQRIAIARAAMRRAPVVVLDEPTTGLDQVSRRLVDEALARLTRGCTTFVVAHDLDTARSADRILFVDAGRIVEDGSHDELTRQGGRYAALVAQRSRSALRARDLAAHVPSDANRSEDSVANGGSLLWWMKRVRAGAQAP